MNVRKGAIGTVCALALAASCGMYAAAALASDDYYSPTTLGNDAYTNQIDEINDVVVAGQSYDGSISAENTDNLNAAKSQSVTIGEKSDDATAVLVTNETGKVIKEVALRPSDQSAFGSNLLSGGTIADSGTACWYMAPKYSESSYTSPEGLAWTVATNYNIQTTFADGTTAVFHNVNFNGLRTITFKYSQDYSVYYVERTTITNHTPDPTLYYETNLRDYGNDAEFNFHVNSGARMTAREITASRGGAWDDGHSHSIVQAYWQSYPVYQPLYGQPSDSYTNGLYQSLYWNAESLRWRVFDFES